MNDSATLNEMHCTPCEGGVPALLPEQIELLLQNVHGWRTDAEGQRIRKEWRMKDFDAAISFLDQVATIAKQENHHPDLHLTGFRKVAIELTTHAAEGLTENDFIVAAKIDHVPVELQK